MADSPWNHQHPFAGRWDPSDSTVRCMQSIEGEPCTMSEEHECHWWPFDPLSKPQPVKKTEILGEGKVTAGAMRNGNEYSSSGIFVTVLIWNPAVPVRIGDSYRLERLVPPSHEEQMGKLLDKLTEPYRKNEGDPEREEDWGNRGWP